MRPPRAVSRLWLLLATLVAVAPLVATPAAGDPPGPALTTDLQVRLTEAARDPALAEWQRELMAEMARGQQTSRIGRPTSATATSISASSGATWNAVPPPTSRAYHSAIYDPVARRMLVFGGFDGGAQNDTWSLPLSGDPAWAKLRTDGSMPSARYSHSAIHDPVRNRMVIFGGFDGTRRNDVRALLLTETPTWTEIVPSIGPAPTGRQWHSAIYDPVRDRMVVFGGLDPSGVFRNDVWTLSLSGTPTWNELVPSGDLPAGRYLHAAIYDPVRDRMLVMGGLNDNGGLGDTWALSLSGSPAWTEIAVTGPPGRSAATMIYDPVRDRALLFGGFGGTGNDVWALSLSGTVAWSELPAAGSLPPARSNHTATYDAQGDRMVVFGGLGFDGSHRSDSWALSLSGSPTWSQLTETGPAISPTLPIAIYDPLRARMVVFRGGNAVTDGVWALSLSGPPSWSRILAAGTPPPIRLQYAGVYDSQRDRMVIFGGGSDTWALAFSGTPTWTRLTPSGNPPPADFGHSAIYDPVGDRMVIFGGQRLSQLYNGAWALAFANGPAWSDLAPITAAPTPRSGHSAIYDAPRGRMVVFGGRDQTGYKNDVWALTLSGSMVWSAIVPDGGLPVARSQHAAIPDPLRDRMVVFGGSSDFGHYNDTWALSLSDHPAWRDLSPPSETPSPRRSAAAIYDAQSDRLLVFGGILARHYNDTWSLDLALPPTLSVSLSPAVLWPPNRKLVSVHATITAENGVVSLKSVTSDEPDEGTSPSDVPQDIQGVDLGTADVDFQLRAERDISGDGRTYTVCYEASNAIGATTQCETVTVPKDHRGQATLARSSAGGWILTCFGDASMSARNIVPSSVSVVTGSLVQSHPAEGAGTFEDVDGDAIEDVHFAMGLDPLADHFGPGEIRYAWWEASGQHYLAEVALSPVDVEPYGNPGYLKASISNPAQNRAWIRYALPHADKVQLTIYDTMGRQVARPVDGWREAGWHAVSFDGGRTSQVYLYRLQWMEQSITGKFAVLK